jgi:hypothetical protein
MAHHNGGSVVRTNQYEILNHHDKASGNLRGFRVRSFEKSVVILRGPGKQVQNWLKHSQSDSAFSQTTMMKQKPH